MKGKDYKKILDKFKSGEEFKFALISALADDREIYDVQANELRAWNSAFASLDNCISSTFCNKREDLIEQLQSYDLIMWELTFDRLNRIPWIVQQYPDSIVIGIIEGTLESPTTVDATAQYWFWNVFQHCDAVGYLVEDTKSYYRLFSDKAFFAGIPYPCEWVIDQGRIRYEPEEGYPIIIELMSTLDHNKNGITTLLTAKKLKEIYGDKIQIVGYPMGKEMWDYVTHEIFPPFQIQTGFIGSWQEWFLHRKVTIGLHLDHRRTWGRYPLDCASIKVPCVSTHAHTHEIVFPDCVVDPFDIDRAIDKISTLIEDKDYREEIGNYAFNSIEQFNYKNSIERLFDGLRDRLMGGTFIGIDPARKEN